MAGQSGQEQSLLDDHSAVVEAEELGAAEELHREECLTWKKGGRDK